MARYSDSQVVQTVWYVQLRIMLAEKNNALNERRKEERARGELERARACVCMYCREGGTV